MSVNTLHFSYIVYVTEYQEVISVVVSVLKENVIWES